MKATCRAVTPLTGSRIGACLALTLSFLVLADANKHAAAWPTHPGRWTAFANWNTPAVHMALLPGGPSGQHSRVVWWNHGEETPIGKVLGWNPPSDAAVNGGTFPAFTEYTLEGPLPNWFCAGHTFAADGRLLVTGGDERAEVGIRETGFLDLAADANGQYVTADNMAKRRWYPTNTMLPGGKIVTHSGSSGFPYVALGGKNGAGATVATLERMDMAPISESWEPTLTPFDPITSTTMGPVSDATVATADGKHYVFGGRNAAGLPVNNVIELARDRNVDGSDYAFHSKPKNSGVVPLARTGHTAVAISDTTFVIIGGHDNLLMATDRVWLARSKSEVLTWTRLDPAGPDPIPTLRGAVAVFDSGRVFVFGGATTLSGPADNSLLYAMRINVAANTYELTSVQENGTRPPPRAYATMTLDPRGHRLDALSLDPAWRYRRALLFGGQLANGSFTNELHALWVKDSATVLWQAITPSASPAARAHHAAAADDNSGQLVISGGEVTQGTADASVWAFDLLCGDPSDCNVATQEWQQRENLPQALRRHAAVRFGFEPAFPRHPEVFDPSTPASGNSWTLLSNAPRWHEWYPFGFSMPRLPGDVGDRQRVFYAGPDAVSMALEVGASTGTWSTYGSTAASGTSFTGGSAVLYRPDRVMKCGSRDTEGGDSHGLTASLVLDAVPPAWIRSNNEMIGRNNHNLVLLPGGETMVIGGGRLHANAFTVEGQTVPFPQVWNPDTSDVLLNWKGHWYGTDPLEFQFASSTVRRNYHTTALLMPDGRVLIAGGNERFDDHDNRAEVYSPWYLFGPGPGPDYPPAVRPVITSAAQRVNYGRTFEVRVSVPFSDVSKAALIRPASTTHGFDQNQRYVPLNYSYLGPAAGGGSVLCVNAPADSFAAPPGDYMLFVLNNAGTPAVAPWVRVERFNGHPSRVVDLDAVVGSFSGSDNGIDIDWTPPGDDSLGACRGPATQYQIRWKYGGMTSWSDWASGSLVANPPTPGVPGGPRQSVRITGLTPGSSFSVALVSRNSVTSTGNWSAMSNVLVVHLAGGGGEGGGEGEILHLGAGSDQMLAGGEEALVARDPFQSNTLFPGMPAGELRTDRIPLPRGPRWEGERAQVRLRRWGNGSLVVHSARLVAVDHAEGKAISDGASVSVGTVAEAASVTSESGEDLESALAGPDGLELRAGAVVHVDLGAPGVRALLVRLSDDVRATEGARTGLEVQVPGGSGWTSLATVIPRELPTDQLVPLPGSSAVRLVAVGGCRLHAAGRVEVIENGASRSPHEPVAVYHSVIGELPATLGAPGVSIGGGESLIIEYIPSELVSGVERDWFLEVTGSQTAGSIAAASSEISLRESPTEVAPLEFALHPARPNPSATSVAFGFDLPKASGVRLEVFDLFGRRVANVVDSEWPAGRHRVAWDGRTSAGRLAPAGVYTLRLITTEFSARRQFVRMP